MRAVFLGAFLCAAVCVISTARPAAAQDVGQARALFERGLAAARDEQWEEALTAFRASLAIVERPSTLLNLAGAEVRTGHVRDAITSYQRFLELATARDAHRREALSALAGAQAQLAHLSLRVEGAAPGDQVTLDAAPVAPGMLDVDPGAHVVTVMRGGRELTRARIDLDPGATHELVLAVTADTPREAEPDITPVDEPVTPPPSAGSDDTVWTVLGVCLGAAAVAGITVGIVVATQPSAPEPYMGNFGMPIRF